MAISTSTFQTSAIAPFLATALDPRRQKMMRILAKAAFARDIITANDYVSTDAAAKQLVTDARKYAGYLQSPDLLNAARVWAWGVANVSITSFPSSSTRLSRIGLWSALDDQTLDQMELLLDYFASGAT